MVEGPKYHRHAQLLSRSLRGLKLRTVLRASREQAAFLSSLVECIILRVFAVGKELFVVFSVRWDPQREGTSYLFNGT